jgi:hypothetical protein
MRNPHRRERLDAGEVFRELDVVDMGEGEFWVKKRRSGVMRCALWRPRGDWRDWHRLRRWRRWFVRFSTARHSIHRGHDEGVDVEIDDDSLRKGVVGVLGGEEKEWRAHLYSRRSSSRFEARSSAVP